MLGGLARTTDFRWWGDRISISVSIGAAQAEKGESLDRLLERAQSAMSASVHGHQRSSREVVSGALGVDEVHWLCQVELLEEVPSQTPYISRIDEKPTGKFALN